MPANVKLKDAKDFKIIGKPVKRLDTRAKVHRARRSSAWTRVPRDAVRGRGRNARCSAVKSPASMRTKAKSVPGVKDVVQTSRGVAVVADNTWAAMQGRKALTVQWDEGAGANVSSASIRQMFVQRARNPAA